MDLDEALYRGITGRSPATEGGPLTRVVGELVRALGTTTPAGISDRTWRRVRANPSGSYSPATNDALRRAQRAARVSPGRRALLRGRPIIGVGGDVTISSDTRSRRFLLSRWTSPNTDGGTQGDTTGLMRDVLDKWLAGDDAGASALFLAAMERGLTGDATLGRSVRLDDMEPVKFWPPNDSGRRSAVMWQRS